MRKQSLKCCNRYVRMGCCPVGNGTVPSVWPNTSPGWLTMSFSSSHSFIVASVKSISMLWRMIVASMKRKIFRRLLLLSRICIRMERSQGKRAFNIPIVCSEVIRIFASLLLKASWSGGRVAPKGFLYEETMIELLEKAESPKMYSRSEKYSAGFLWRWVRFQILLSWADPGNPAR